MLISVTRKIKTRNSLAQAGFKIVKSGTTLVLTLSLSVFQYVDV